MELSILVAKIISLIYLAFGIGVLIKSIDFMAIVDQIEKSQAIIFLSGTIGMAVGVVLVDQHNLWVADWRLLITLVSWGMLLGGFVLVLMPNLFITIIKLTQGFLKNTLLMGLFMITFGLVMGYFGFFL